LQVRLADTAPIMPQRAQSVSQFATPSLEAKRQWLATVPTAPVPGKLLVDKKLQVLGVRQFERRNVLGRGALSLLRVATLGVVKPSSWTLSRPAPALSVPLRAEFGFGGECRVVADTIEAERVPAKQRLTEEQQAAHVPVDALLGRSTVAYAAFPANPLGRGYAESWFIHATKARYIAAPQIEVPAAPISIRNFNACVKGRRTEEMASRVRIGYGVRPKSHPDRLRLAGTIDSDFAKSDRWLPEDFDFAIWNAAEPDQQTHFLNGGEVIELINMCPHDSPGATRDMAGNTVLRLQLPTSECYVLLRLDSGEMFTHAMAIDTVIVEPDERKVSLVWRTILAKAGDVSLRVVEAMTRSHAQRDLDRLEVEGFKAKMDDLHQFVRDNDDE
jgi:hypothetical protein